MRKRTVFVARAVLLLLAVDVSFALGGCAALRWGPGFEPNGVPAPGTTPAPAGTGTTPAPAGTPAPDANGQAGDHLIGDYGPVSVDWSGYLEEIAKLAATGGLSIIGALTAYTKYVRPRRQAKETNSALVAAVEQLTGASLSAKAPASKPTSSPTKANGEA